MDKDKFLDFLSRHLSKFLLGVALLGLLGFLFERRSSSHKIHSKQDYLIVRQIYERFRKGEPISTESLETAEKIIHRHPELRAKYDPLMAYSLLQQEKVAQALPYASSILKRVQHYPYHDYALGTLLITEENYPEAYVQAERLEKSLGERDNYPTLRAFNLLRLVFLADELNNQELKAGYWTTLQSHAAFSEIEPLFQEGSLTLKDFVEKHS
ncbi:MAG: hypothetical protein KR126chlam2_00067 [Chlamydiae bacterium]|nr:hypothetical protein [Chlamydiota bacterium]